MHVTVLVDPFPHEESIIEAAAQMLVDEFRESWPEAWPTFPDARAEVVTALAPDKVAFAALADGALLGWVGAQPMYDGNVWELHPIVVRGDVQRRGVGRALVQRLEADLRGRGALTLWLGTDDEANLTTVGGIDVYPGIAQKLCALDSDKHHPVTFYRKLGFEVAGLVPDANGFGKPDILMAKRIALLQR